MRHLTRWMLALAASGCACGQGQVDVWLGFPEVGQRETLVLVHGTPEDRRVEVVDPAAGSTEVVIRSDEGAPDPFALTFDARAADVALPVGSSDVVAPREGRLLFGPSSAFFEGAPIGVFSLQRRRQPPSAAWRPLAAVPSELAAVALPFDAKCPAFGQPLWGETLTPYRTVTVHRIDDTNALLVTRAITGDDARWVATPSGLSRAGPGERVTAIQGVDDAIWLADGVGAMWRAEADRSEGWRRKTQLPVPSLQRPVLGFTTSGTTADIFVGTTEPAILHFDGERWTSLGRARLRPGMIVSTGPGSALLVDDQGRLTEASPDGLREVVNAPQALHSLQLIDGIGPVVGDELGTFYTRGEDQWTQVVPQRFGWFGLAAIASGDGLLFLLGSGLGGFYSRATRLCEDLFVLRFLNTGRLIAMNDALLVVGEVGSAEDVDVLWVPRR